MRFALLGDSPACLPIIRTLGASPQHALAVAACSDGLEAELQRAAPAVEIARDWQQLLVAQVEPIIVCGSRPDVLEAVRRLAEAGKRLIVLPDARQGSAFAYSLLPVAEDRPVALLPVFAHRFDARWRTVREKLQGEGVQTARFLQLDRTQAKSSSGALTLPEVDDALLRDADLLRWLAGDFSRVTCVLTGATDRDTARASVTLTGTGSAEATWTMQSAPQPSQLRLSVTLPAGESLVEIDNAPGAWSDESAARLLEEFAEATARPSARSDWPEVVRAFDIVDAARRSVRRRRTIEISDEDVSERSQFKTQMTAVGCGLLAYTLLGVVAALLVGKLLDPRDAAQVRSETAGFVVYREQFLPGTAELTPAGERHVDEFSGRLWHSPAEVLVERDDAALDAARRETVVTRIAAHGAGDVSDRVDVRALAGRSFRRVMIGLWLVVFLPLAAFLLLQGLIVLARPAKERSGIRKGSESPGT